MPSPEFRAPTFPAAAMGLETTLARESNLGNCCQPLGEQRDLTP